MENVGMMKDILKREDWQFRPGIEVRPAGDGPDGSRRVPVLALLSHEPISAPPAEVRIHGPVDAEISRAG